MIEKRYFKGEAVLRVIRDMCESDAHFRTFNADTLTRKIAALPVEDVRPVIRGEWKKDGDVVVCSNCGEEHGWIDYRASFCEDCGADMRAANARFYEEQDELETLGPEDGEGEEAGA